MNFNKERPDESVESLPLRFNYEFSRVYKRGTFACGRCITVHAFRRPKGIKHNLTPIPRDIIRVGFCANKRLLGAVGRNRARRLMREAYRRQEPGIVHGYDIVITLRNLESMPAYDEIAADLAKCIKKLGLINVVTTDGSEASD